MREPARPTTTVRHLATLVAALGLALTTVVAAPGSPAAAQEPSGADLIEACQPATEIPELGPRACKSLEAGVWLGAQACRRAPGAEGEMCPYVDGRDTSDAAMAEYQESWTARALELQRQLDVDVPLVQALLPHTHNSANSTAYDPSVTTLDANQIVSVTDQLDLGIRAIEYDIHWVPHPEGDPAQGFREVVQCHGQSQGTPAGAVHAGCSVDQPLTPLLEELRAWLDANPDELVLVYLENVLDGDPAAHARAAEVVDATIGDLVFRPEAGGGCQDLPVRTESKSSILATGARVLITGNCGPAGSSWNDLVFQRGTAWDESGSTTDYECAEDRGGVTYEDTLVRRYEDSTWLSGMATGGSHITAEVMADMVRCGVNLPGFDQIHAGDDRLDSLVWSWAPDQPALGATGMCAQQATNARFVTADCAASAPVACRTTAGGWAVTTEAVPWAEGDRACADAGHLSAGVPFNGRDNGLLRAAADGAGAGAVWLAYGQDASGAWVTGIPESEDPVEPEPEPETPGRGHHGRPDQPGPPAASGGGRPTSIDGSAASSTTTGGVVGLLVALLGIGAVGIGGARRRRSSRGPVGETGPRPGVTRRP